jgi:hypothetical protein
MSVYSSVIGNIGSRVVIFGWSIGDQDDHILKAICSNDHIESLAVSVVSEDEDIESRCSDVEKKIRKTKGDDGFEVKFFDAKSKGCWANP